MERDLSQEAAEQLLSGDLTPPPYGTERLAALLAAASAPGRPDELAGEAAAMAAFRAQPQTVRRWSLRRALTIKVAAVVAATVAAGGVALASGTGLLPLPFLPGKIGPIPSSTDGPAGRSPVPGHTTNPAPAPPNDALHALCVEYQKKTADQKQKDLKGKHFEELVKAAGDAVNVEAFCVRVLAATPTPSKSRAEDGPGNGNPDNGGQDAGQPRPTTPPTMPPAAPPAAPPTGPPNGMHTGADPTG